jgi:hypothetical protein
MKYDKIITSKYCKEKIEVKVMKPNLCGGFVKGVINLGEFQEISL